MLKTANQIDLCLLQEQKESETGTGPAFLVLRFRVNRRQLENYASHGLQITNRVWTIAELISS